MSNVPYFSILIPTKNRSHIVGYAVQSVLNQKFKDFEIILVDNDDSDATANVIRTIADPRIKYFRTGGLNMCQNWQFALKMSSGKFVTVLEDKQAYYPDALANLHHTFEELDVEVVVWHWDIFNDNIKLAYQTTHETGAELLTSEQILQEYVELSADVWEKLPRMINSCASSRLIKQIEEHPNIDSFFAYLSPDLCAAFYSLATVDNIAVLKKSLGLVGYFQLSNAFQSLSKKKLDPFHFYGKGNYEHVIVDTVPIKNTTLLHNSIYNDYLRSRSKLGGKLQRFEMTTGNYARMCVKDLARISGDTSQTRKAILSFLSTNNVSKWPLVSLYFRSWFVRKLGEITWLSQLRDRMKKSRWGARNILEASQTRPRLTTGTSTQILSD